MIFVGLALSFKSGIKLPLTKSTNIYMNMWLLSIEISMDGNTVTHDRN